MENFESRPGNKTPKSAGKGLFCVTTTNKGFSFSPIPYRANKSNEFAYRISVIFRVRSARKVRITDANLIRKLGIVVLTFSGCLMIRTVLAPPKVITVRTGDDLKAYLCDTTVWDHLFSISEYIYIA